MNHAELSRDLALSLGYCPESVETEQEQCRVFRLLPSKAVDWPVWLNFDYRAPTVCLPLIEWLMLRGVNVWNPDGIPTVWTWSEPDGDYGKAETLSEAVARAVIAVKQGQRTAHENREVLQP